MKTKSSCAAPAPQRSIDPQKRRRKFVVIAACLVLAYPAIELVSFLVLAGFEKTQPKTFVLRTDEAFKGMDRGDLEAYFKGSYDPVLGWDNKPGASSTENNCLGVNWTESFGPDGAREVPQDFGSALIASYGDSYLKGGEVSNHQTWQYQLAQSMGHDVKNYAVGAYGTYQAVLKLKRHIEQGRVYPVTLLGIHEQNIKRVVNLYRPFLYSRRSDRLTFKPGLGCAGDKCVRIGNPLQPDATSMADARRALSEAHRWDYWVRHRPAFEFPWSVNAFKLVRLAIEDLAKTVQEPLWYAREGIAAMDEVLAEFRDAVTKVGSLPVVLFIPNGSNGGPASYGAYKERISKRYPDLVVLDLSETQFDAKRFRLKPMSCHPSEYGHSVIASLVREGLSEIDGGSAPSLSKIALVEKTQ